VKIGISSCFLHDNPMKDVFNSRSLYYIESSFVNYLQQFDVCTYVIPPNYVSSNNIDRTIDGVDGVILHGGVDICPLTYNEVPLDKRWQGDRLRDYYDLKLLECCFKKDKPVFGICRGLQIINIFLGGSIYQDITTQLPGAIIHRDASIYEKNYHKIDFPADKLLEKTFNIKSAWVNSVHHQAIKDLASGLEVEAVSSKDKVIEATKLKQSRSDDMFAFGVQWHPEFHLPLDVKFLDSRQIVGFFLDAAAQRIT
jgi:putative glutamine amidotransferase